MSNTMELNKAAQARSDDASQAAREKCNKAMIFGGFESEDMLLRAMTFDARRTAVYVNRFMINGDLQAFIDGICAIHGAIARGSLERKESPDNSSMIVGGTFGGIG